MLWKHLADLWSMWDTIEFSSITELQIRCLKWTSIDSICVISSPNPMCQSDDSNKWLNIVSGEETYILETLFRALSPWLDCSSSCFIWIKWPPLLCVLLLYGWTVKPVMSDHHIQKSGGHYQQVFTNCRSKVMYKTPVRVFCITFNLHLMSTCITGHQIAFLYSQNCHIRLSVGPWKKSWRQLVA